MARVVTFGRMPTTPPPGTFRRVNFPELAKLDQGTNEGWVNRILSSEGGDTRSLPRTISFQELDTVGHDRAAAVGAIYEVTIDGETGIMSGSGWLADDEWGRKAEIAILSKKLHHNSVDLAEVSEVEYDYHGDPWDDDFTVDVIFKKWRFGKTTIVALPAFADAHAELAEELAASLGADEPLVVDCPTKFTSNSAVEIVAGIETRPRYEGFFVPEPDTLTSVTVGEPDETGWVPIFGHLADWKRQHRNASGRLVYPPRSKDNYATYCSGKVLTDHGFVKAGPVTLLGGHVSLQDAAEKVENTWADVRVIDGKLGPWMCGYVRPHISRDQAALYVARASQVSGYWPDGETLRLICSVNAAGFPVLEPDSKDGEFALAASLGTADDEPRRGGLVIDLPAGFKSFSELSDDDKMAFREMLKESFSIGAPPKRSIYTKDTDSAEAPDGVDESLEQAAIEERARLLAEGPLADLLDDE